MSLDPVEEARYRFRLAIEHLERARTLFSQGDWVGAVLSSQLAVENFARTVIALFEVPTWSHDPSSQLDRLIEKIPSDVAEAAAELSSMARELAPDHGRASYGEPSQGLTPRDIYRREHAADALRKCLRAKDLCERILNRLGVSLRG